MSEMRQPGSGADSSIRNTPGASTASGSGNAWMSRISLIRLTAAAHHAASGAPARPPSASAVARSASRSPVSHGSGWPGPAAAKQGPSWRTAISHSRRSYRLCTRPGTYWYWPALINGTEWQVGATVFGHGDPPNSGDTCTRSTILDPPKHQSAHARRWLVSCLDVLPNALGAGTAAAAAPPATWRRSVSATMKPSCPLRFKESLDRFLLVSART